MKGYFKMIKYTPFWKTLAKSNESTYTLIHKHNKSSSIINRLKNNRGITTTTIDDLCKLLHCRVEDILVYEEDSNTKTHNLLNDK